MNALPKIGWIGPLSARRFDDERARRVAAALGERAERAHPRPRRVPRGARPILGLLLVGFAGFALHALAANGSLSTRAVGAQGGGVPSVESGDQEMQRMRSFVAGVVGVGVMTTGAAAQQAVQWRVQDGGNGHWYQLVIPPSRVNIDQALAGSRALGGDLVSISNAAENIFVFQIAQQDPSRWQLVWPGATQIGGPWIGARFVSPNWVWTDGTAWAFTAWSANNPNYMDEEHAVLYMGYAGGPPTSEWNNIQPYYLNWGYVVEWSADCNNDGIVDYGQILAGQLADTNQNGVPDCCEQGNPCFLTIGLDAHYAFDGNTNDSSGNARHAVSFNTSFTADRFGRPNSACAFDGVSGYLIASGIPIHTDNAFSWAMWIRCDNPNVHRPILHRAAAMGDNRHSPSLWTDPGGSMSFSSYEIGMGGSAVDTPSGALSPGQWRHFVGTSSASGTRRVYIDGALVASGSSSSYGEALPLLLIGRDPIAPWYFTGALDDIRIYGRELSASEVSVLYQWPMAPCPGDVTRNGTVDGVDLAALLAAWGGGKSQFDCDIDNDGVVGGSDLAVVLAGWGACP